MRIFSLELNNDIKGIKERKKYIESLISCLPNPDLVLLPELALPSYMPNHNIWKYADDSGKDTSKWAQEMAEKYDTFIGVGYLDYDNGDYYNRYMITDNKNIYGIVTKSEAEAAVFKRGWFNNLINTPFGNVAVGICYDSQRKHFYESIKDEAISLIVFPYGSPYDPKKDKEENEVNDYLGNLYSHAFRVPVIYVNSYGKLEYMLGIMGLLMKLLGFTMNGKSKIYAPTGTKINLQIKEARGIDVKLVNNKRKKDINFYGQNLIKGNYFFRNVVLKLNIKLGIRKYNKLIKTKK